MIKNQGKSGQLQFELESLEPRLMLSGEGAAAVPVEQVVLYTTNEQEVFEEGGSDLCLRPVNTSIASLFEKDGVDMAASQQSEASACSESIAEESGVDEAATAESFVVSPSDTLSGSITIDGDVVNSGTIEPGNSPGIITINGDLTLDGNDPDSADPGDGYDPGSSDTVGSLNIELGGLNAGAATDGYDQVNVTGNLNLGGLLNISLIDGFVPSAGDTFNILTYGGALSGAFADATGLFGFGDGSLYFDINIIDEISGPDIVQLEAKELLGAGGFLPDFASIATDKINDLGKFLGTYFSEAPITVTGGFDLSSAIDVEGTLTFSKEGSTIEIGATSVTAFLGENYKLPGERGVKITGEGGLLMNTSGVATNISGSADLVGFSDFSLSGSNLNVEVNTTGVAVSQTIAVGAGTVDVINLPESPCVEFPVEIWGCQADCCKDFCNH